MANNKTTLPHESANLFFTDGGLETTLVFLEGFDLPNFAAFELLKNEEQCPNLNGEFVIRVLNKLLIIKRKQKMTPKEIAKTWFANIDAKNFEGVKYLMASNHTFHNPMTPAPVGVEEHLGMMQMMTSSFDGQHHLDQLIEEGNCVVVRGHWSGKHVGEFNGVPATGNEVIFPWIDIFEMVEGKVTKEYFELNPMSIMAQIGGMENQNA